MDAVVLPGCPRLRVSHISLAGSLLLTLAVSSQNIVRIRIYVKCGRIFLTSQNEESIGANAGGHLGLFVKHYAPIVQGFAKVNFEGKCLCKLVLSLGKKTIGFRAHLGPGPSAQCC